MSMCCFEDAAIIEGWFCSRDLSCCTCLLLARVTPLHRSLIPQLNLGTSYLWLPPPVFLRMALVFVCSVQKTLFSQLLSACLQGALEKGHLVCACCRDRHWLMGSPPVQCSHLCIPRSKSQTAHYLKLPNFKALRSHNSHCIFYP